jgi:hypothetical protein
MIIAADRKGKLLDEVKAFPETLNGFQLKRFPMPTNWIESRKAKQIKVERFGSLALARVGGAR